MTDWFENLKSIFRESPRMWAVSAVALLVGLFAVWTIYGGFSFGLNRFFASGECGNEGGTCMYACPSGLRSSYSQASNDDCDYESVGYVCCLTDTSSAAPTANLDVSPTTTTSGGVVNVSWSSTNATSCTVTAGTFSTNGEAQGNTTDTISSSFTGTAQFRIRCTGTGGSVDSRIVYVTVTAPTGGTNNNNGDPECGPTIPNGGRLDWSFRNSEPWDDCVEGVSNAQAAQYWTEADVSACHPDEGFHLVWRAQHRPRATCNMKDEPVDVEYSEGQGIVTDNGNFNDVNDLAPDTAGKARMTYTTSTTNCGSVHMFGAFWAEDAQNPLTYKHNNAGNAGYHKVINYGKDCGAATPIPTASPSTSASPSATPTASPTPTVSPSTSVAPLETVACAPVIQTVKVNQAARLEASGGNGAYKWIIIQGGQLKEGGNQYIGVSYGAVGNKTLRVDSAGMNATCTVDVVADDSQTPTEALKVQKTGRNTTSGEPSDSNAITVYPGQTAQFRVQIVNNTSSGINQVKLTDTVPPGMSYVSGSTRVENQSIAADSVATTGLSVGRLDPDESVSVQWSAVADRTSTISGGPNRSSPAVRVTGSGISDVTAEMSVTVYGSGTSGPGGVPTGPGDAVLAALLAAAVLTLLYSGYTRSGLYRRREAAAMSRDQGPMDFRS